MIGGAGRDSQMAFSAQIFTLPTSTITASGFAVGVCYGANARFYGLEEDKPPVAKVDTSEN
jgi:hypothetical protein